MILVLAFALWSVLLVAVAVMTGFSMLVYAAAAMCCAAVGFAVLVLAVGLRSSYPDGAGQYGYDMRGRHKQSLVAY